MNLSQVLAKIQETVDPSVSESWDRNGLLIGDPTQECQRVLVASDLTKNSLKEAQTRGCQLIVTHHPCFFPAGKAGGLASLIAPGGQPSDLRLAAFASGISVAAFHTSYDRCALAPLEKLAQKLRLGRPKGRFMDPNETYLKLVVYVPHKDEDKIKQALFNAGAGVISQYDSCSFKTPGVGTFRGSDQTRPRLGEPLKLEEAEEIRLEVVLPTVLKARVDRALLKAHPYEEVARDYFETQLQTRDIRLGFYPYVGYGFYADFEDPVGADKFKQIVCNVFEVEGFFKTGDFPQKVKRVGFTPGKGDSFIRSALQNDVDVLITGEAGFHPAREAIQQGLCTLELGHTESELPFFWFLEDTLKNDVKIHIYREKLQSFCKK